VRERQAGLKRPSQLLKKRALWENRSAVGLLNCAAKLGDRRKRKSWENIKKKTEGSFKQKGLETLCNHLRQPSNLERFRPKKKVEI